MKQLCLALVLWLFVPGVLYAAESELLTVSTTAKSITASPCPSAILEVVTNTIFYSLHDPTVTPDSTSHTLAAGGVLTLTEPFKFRAVRSGGTDATVRVTCIAGLQETRIVKAAGTGGGGDGKILDGTAAGQADVMSSAPIGTEEGLVVRCASGCAGSGGTSSSFGAAFPATGTAGGFSDGTNMQGGRVFDADTGVGTQYVVGTLLKKSASGGSVDFGTSTDPIRTDPTGTTTQPVSGTVNIGTFPANQPVNVSQFGGSTVVTGVGASGVGIPRITVSNDSSLAANQSVNLNQVGATSVTTDTTQPTNAKAAITVRQPISCTNRIALSQTADTQVVTGTAGQKIYICAIMLIAAAAETVNIIEGTGAVCAISPTALYGSTTKTNGMAFAANGGFGQTSGQPFVHTAVSGNNLCVTQVGTARIAGSISFIVAAD